MVIDISRSVGVVRDSPPGKDVRLSADAQCREESLFHFNALTLWTLDLEVVLLACPRLDVKVDARTRLNLSAERGKQLATVDFVVRSSLGAFKLINALGMNSRGRTGKYPDRS